MKQKILITRPLSADLVGRLRKYFDVEVNEGPRYSAAELKEALKDKQGVLVAGGEKIDAELLSGLDGLHAVCVSAAGYNNVDVSALTRLGVIVTNAPGPADDTTADFAWGALIALARRLPEAERWVQEGQWTGPAGSRFFGADIHGRTLGVIGMGRIGQAIARRAIGFRMVTLYHNRHRLEEVIERDCRAEFLSKAELLGRSDFVILSLPYATENHHIIGAEELGVMRPSAYLINIARGGLIDEAALAEAIRQRKLAGAALDVFEGEPAIHPGLKGLPNVLLTPHIAGATEGTQYGLASMAADNLIAALGSGPDAGRPPAILNPEVL
jgi:glyoxylate/hydroxypyruvate/2-ketogluconate reductase